MRLVEHSIPAKQSIYSSYIHNDPNLADFYHFYPHQPNSIHERLRWLDDTEQHRANRTQLSEVLRQYNTSIGAGPKAIEHIRSLADPQTVCIIGGQQAGLLTGPMYTIYKAISIIQKAKEQEHKLSRKVVPVFWIAGEDHDWDEVNHVYLPDRYGQAVKHRWHEGPHPDRRFSISHWSVKTGGFDRFLTKVFGEIPDSPYKSQIHNELQKLASASETLSSFFARIMGWLFYNEGLIMVDAADPNVRKIESPFFKKLILANEELHDSLQERKYELEKRGFPSPIEINPRDAHLFIYQHRERLLLQRDNKGQTFETKVGRFPYTTQQLLDIAEHHPAQLSTNVFFRTLMQEYLFPTLYTSLGPGEVAYWGLFGKAFEALGMRMPLIMPRFGATLVEPYEDKWMKRYRIAWKDIYEGLDRHKYEWLHQQGLAVWNKDFAQVKRSFEEVYKPLVDKVSHYDNGLRSLAQSNMDRITKQIHFLERQVERSMHRKLEDDLRRMDHLQGTLWPLGSPQERIYPIIIYICRYGLDWWEAFKQEDWDLYKPHQLVYL